VSVKINIGVAYNGRNIKKSWADLQRLARQADTTSARIKVLGAQMQLVGRTMTSVGQTMTRKVSMPLALIGGYAVKTAAEFETSFAKIQGLVGVSASEIGELEEAAARLGPATGRSSNEAAEALFFITSAGLRGAEAIETLEASLKASAIGLGETAVVADLVTSATNAYGSSVLSATRATDTLTAAVRYGKLEPADLAGSMGMVLPVASAMGVSFDEVGAAFAAMSRTGTDASTAATQLRQILATILNPTKEARDELEKYGLSAQGLRQQLRERGLLSVLQTLTSTLGLNDDAIAKVFGNIRALSGVLDLMGSNVQATEQIFADMANTTGMLDDAFAITAETSAFKFQRALSELKETLRGVGETLMPIVQRIIDGVQGLIDRFNALSPAQQDIIVQMAGLAALTGPVMMFVGNLLSGIGLLIIAMGKMTIATALATGGLSLLAGLIGLAIWKSAAGESDKRATALELEAEAADLAAAGYHAMAEARLADAAAARAQADQSDNEIRRFTNQAEAQRRARAEQEAAAAAAAALEEAMASLGLATDDTTDSVGASGPKVVALTSYMRDLLQELNQTHVGAGDAGDAIAQFSREVLAMGSITEETVRGAQKLAQVIKQDIDRSLADANRRLEEATKKFEDYRDAIAEGITQGNRLSDAASSQSTAIEQLAQAQQAYQDALASEDPERIAKAAEQLEDAKDAQGSFVEFLQTGLTTAEGFANQIDTLRLAGASMQVVQEIAELGARTGGRIAAELLAGGAAAIEQANALVAATEAAARRAGDAAAQQFYGAGVRAAQGFVAAVEASIPALQGVLDRIADMIEAALGERPDVRIDGSQGPFVQSSQPSGPVRNRMGNLPFVPDPSAPLPKLPAGLEWGIGGLPALAEGGIVMGPTLALIGEAGPEAVVPLSRGMGGGQTIVNVTVTSADPQAVVEAIRRYTRSNGPLGSSVTL
jgi:TP901 family phage tail tape measure protein